MRPPVPDPQTTRRLRSAKPRRGRTPRAPRTDPIERDYLRVLLSDIVDPAIALVDKHVDARAIAVSAGLRRDSFKLMLHTQLGRVRVDYAQMVTRNVFERAPLEAARQTSKMTATVLRRQVREVLAVDIGDAAEGVATETTLRDWTAANVDLIITVPERYFDEIESDVFEFVAAGSRAAELVERIEGLGDHPRFNAARIARDQIGKLTSNLTKARQRDIGVAEYVWSTSQDERVRSEHAERDGRTFSWDEPPEDGHPGEPIQCRCVALPKLESIEL